MDVNALTPVAVGFDTWGPYDAEHFVGVVFWRRPCACRRAVVATRRNTWLHLRTRRDGLSYPGPNLYTQGETITPLVPTVTGKPSSYFVAPDLPAGLSLSSDGVISGTPTERKSPETYLVTAANKSGSSSFGVRITVLGRYSIGGMVSGLTGTGLVLTNNGVDNLAIVANGPFTFAGQLPASAAYNVVVASQPAGQTCSVAGGGGSTDQRQLQRRGCHVQARMWARLRGSGTWPSTTLAECSTSPASIHLHPDLSTDM